MNHITAAAAEFPFLYYQRIFVKGYFAFATPSVMPIHSALADGYIYIRRRTKGLRIRDLDNAFTRDKPHGQPVGVRANPARNIEVKNCLSAEVRIKGRDESLTWLFSRDDLPRIINDETFTEFLACLPVKQSSGSPIGNLNIVTAYYASFIDWYRIITGDVSMTGPDHWNSHIPIYGECLVDIRGHGDRTIDEVVLDVDPGAFSPVMFHTDVEPNETGPRSKPTGDISDEERIAHYLRTGKTLPPIHKRLQIFCILRRKQRTGHSWRFRCFLFLNNTLTGSCGRLALGTGHFRTSWMRGHLRTALCFLERGFAG